MNWGALKTQAHILKTAYFNAAGVSGDKQTSVGNTEVELFLNEGYIEGAVISKCVREIKSITLVPAQATYDFPDDIIRVDKIWTNHSGTYQEMNELALCDYPDSLNHSTDAVLFYSTEITSGKIELYGTPSAAGKLVKIASAIRPAAMTNDTESPLIPSQYHSAILDYFTYRLYDFIAASAPEKSNLVGMAQNHFTLWNNKMVACRIEYDYKGKKNFKMRSQ